MLREYTALPQEEIDRQGQVWMFCDEEGCDEAVQITGVEIREYDVGPRRIQEQFASAPEGWRTADPDGNVLTGSADFCPTHADRIFVPPPGAQPEDIPPAE